MGAVDVGREGGELVVELVADEAGGGEVVAFVGADLGDCLVERGVAFEGSRMELDLVAEAEDSFQTTFRGFEPDASHEAMDLVPLGEQEFR